MIKPIDIMDDEQRVHSSDNQSRDKIVDYGEGRADVSRDKLPAETNPRLEYPESNASRVVPPFRPAHPAPQDDSKSMGPALKKRKTTAVEEVTFDFEARSEYLTGFRRRKLHRIKRAQEEAIKQDRLDRLENRKKVRKDLYLPPPPLLTSAKIRLERKEEVESHVSAVNALLRGADDRVVDSTDEEEGTQDDGQEVNVSDANWNGIEDALLAHEDDYIDEDRLTTVTVETVDVTREGLVKVSDGNEEKGPIVKIDRRNEKRVWTKENPKKMKKVKKTKFRYESKVERKITRGKEQAKNKAQAKARRE